MERSVYAIPILCLSLSCATAQSGASMVGASYSAPAAYEVAPGQVVTLFFNGIRPFPDGKLRSATADVQALPVTLAGLSARVTQARHSVDRRVPVFSILQENQCGGTQAISPACLLTAMRVQIPFELSLEPEPDGQPPAPAQLILEEDGQPSKPFPLQPVVVNAHVLTSCDQDWDTRPGSTCNRLAFHPDGRRIGATAPSKRGEVITVYAFGLGPTWPAAETGKPAPGGVEIPQSGVLRVWATLRNQPINASASAPRFFDSEASSLPGDAIQFAGLAPGWVGLYQLNILIPTSFQTVLPCGGEIHSNAVALITSPKGSETVPLCVEH